jgi:type II secretory pathway pseudopilin PulG
MKLNLNKKGQAGMTLIEITLVIAVLLGLISVLFIGVGAYKKGADRAKCILNISSVQKAVRSYSNLNADNASLTISETALVGAGKMFETAPLCPTGGTYTWPTAFPAVGAAYLSCSLSASDGHAPQSTTGW